MIFFGKELRIAAGLIIILFSLNLLGLINFNFLNQDKRFETGEVYIKWDDSTEDEWLILIYIKNNSPDEGIVIEDKTDPEKNMTYEFQSKEIFKASDIMVDALTKLLDTERNKKKVIQ